MNSPLLKTSLVVFLGVTATLVYSAIGLNSIVGALIIFTLALIGYYFSFTIGTSVVVAELVAGSFGRLFVIQLGDFDLTVRIGLFLIALIATVVHVLRDSAVRQYVLKHLRRPEIILLFIVIIWGGIRGLASQPLGQIVDDANAYAYFLLLPTFLIALRDVDGRNRIIATIIGASGAVALISLVILYLFTHATPEPYLRFIYVWVRDLRLGEIARAPGGFYRVFLQSHFWNFILFVWIVPLLFVFKHKRSRKLLYIAGIATAAAVFLSFSRTFWLSAAVASLFGLLVVLLRRNLRENVRSYVISLVLISIVGLSIPFLVTRTIGGEIFTRVGTITGEAAADSRMNLLKVMWPSILEHPILGHGFGKSLTYVTKDPRLLDYFPDGNYTTTAFEWGWLDFWLKMGMFGPASFAFLLFALGKRVMIGIKSESKERAWLSLALGLSLVGASLAHVLSPWLNHPIGIGFLLSVIGILAGLQNQTKTQQSSLQ